MKKTLLSLAAVAALAFGAQEAKAQSPQRAAIGVVFDGTGGDLWGVQYKQSFGGTNNGQAQVMFDDNVVAVGADYQYARPFRGVNGLGWYAGIGAQLTFLDAGNDDMTLVGLRPQLGLEFKIPAAPIGFHADWKPDWRLNHGNDFDASTFTFGIKYTLR
ncbi:hypothetical protein D7322_22410 [Sphingobacterium puteale]|uniref:Outer membrane protein beta-barrel domain-containing protein n=1 Tax=Sphingobacterium puteale TaxID=2420510 RepID=A0A420VSP1_9SPHI|nr:MULTISPECIES: hypothetical protein [Sphingobacterium]QIH32429.1 hypothetical protein G6053_05770 [Sphingobacterium sp. DR205]RKO69342.1 hypothetical protein D7322_22410 [Sphingobacterium puteale]